MTKLDAVNLILRASGLRTVAALQTDSASDAAEAERILDECELEVQSQGWHYNTRKDVELSPNGDDELLVDSNIIEIDTYGEDAHLDVANVGGKLYDLEDNTFEFDESVKVQYTLRYEFACIPLQIRTYIAKYAAYKYAQIRGIGGNMLQQTYDDYILSRSRASSFNSRTRNDNMLDSVHHQRVRGERASVVI